jgi:hypothetical protein
MHMTLKHFAPIVVAAVLGNAPAAFAQFGGRAGDIVIYAVTYNGSGNFQAVPPTTTNAAQNVSNFKVVSLDSVQGVTSEPFPLIRQRFYDTPTETFQVGTDFENTIGLHRVFVYPVKIFEIEGLTNPFGSLLGFPNTLLDFPLGLDVEADLSLETLKVITWFPGAWPFIVVTDHPGPIRPPDVPGYLYFFTLPGLVNVAALLPWVNMSIAYPGAGWQEGIDVKPLEFDSTIGVTIRQLRLRPGTQSPPFRTAGHTHLFVLQGSGTITPLGGGSFNMNKYDYAFLPENFTVTLSNPRQYQAAGVK